MAAGHVVGLAEASSSYSDPESRDAAAGMTVNGLNSFALFMADHFEWTEKLRRVARR